MNFTGGHICLSFDTDTLGIPFPWLPKVSVFRGVVTGAPYAVNFSWLWVSLLFLLYRKQDIDT